MCKSGDTRIRKKNIYKLLEIKDFNKFKFLFKGYKSDKYGYKY